MLYRTLIHETGHILGFDERYTGVGHSHEGFENDVMGGNPAVGVNMAPSHLEASARFAIYVAKGKNIREGAITDFNVDSTAHGSVQQYYTGGRSNPDYATLQGQLESHTWGKFREQFNPTPPPRLQVMPGILRPDRGSPFQILPRHDEQTMPGTIDILRGRF
jgi:hypothetical protein